MGRPSSINGCKGLLLYIVLFLSMFLGLCFWLCLWLNILCWLNILYSLATHSLTTLDILTTHSLATLDSTVALDVLTTHILAALDSTVTHYSTVALDITVACIVFPYPLVSYATIIVHPFI